ncbi:aminopeptidase P family protein [Mesorhizobium sp. M3A.F.Ca.ET.080.04.2.1]|uniref:M24 family metallopeptidase n=1 Tax=Mesorhizobium sp. M3A.F.Ca.ET.080.04.2.1 TaxID=2493676 RepID=UPI000F74FA60|nr:Xaa-Pro peptidase family protein [Mesorhizobium sp. M3A.F.Ca.ET.080.04.2.1]AZO07955.1 aminopeptidase P family protein [Mesorhizobium sp. M3A.F.Ca.ET.080.04.2.1]RWF17822.1 MAG: aminopeptidase P family protein [Mesorhizobium sp.]
MSLHSPAVVKEELPFNTARLDALMDTAGLDVLLVCSKHNVQYMLGGYRFFFFEYMDAIGVSRYLSFFIYEKGSPEHAGYIGNPMERDEKQRFSHWVHESDLGSWKSVDSMNQAIAFIRRNGLAAGRIGVESAFLPADAYNALRAGLPNSDVVDATIVLERLRAIKTPQELDMLRNASEKVVDSMAAVVAIHGAGATKNDLVHALQREEVARGLTWQFCLISMGQSFNRAPSEQIWQPGDVLCLDSGGNYNGWVGDMARMAILGAPDSELQDLLSVIDEIQQACRRLIRPGTLGRDLFPEAQALVDVSRHKDYLSFVIHGMGLITHEAPRLTPNGSVPYEASDAALPLEEGMVLSVETTMLHPRRGFIKLEDTIAVTSNGYEPFGDGHRGWNQAGG